MVLRSAIVEDAQPLMLYTQNESGRENRLLRDSLRRRKALAMKPANSLHLPLFSRPVQLRIPPPNIPGNIPRPLHSAARGHHHTT